MYEIKLPENCSSNCFDSSIYSLLKYNGLEYEAYNIKYFYTDYYESYLDDSKYFIGRRNSDEDYLKSLFNVNLSFKDITESEDLLKIVCDSLSENPIGIVIDPYYCHWSPFYNKTHYSHVFLIVDVDYINKKYKCFDVHFNDVGYVDFDFDILNSKAKKYFFADFKNKSDINLESMINKLLSSLDCFDSDLIAKKSKMISSFTKNDKDVLFSETLETSISLINLMWIAEDKKHFPFALKYIENKIKKAVFSSIYELLKNSERDFLLLKSLLTKYAVTGVLKEAKIESIVTQIYEADALIVKEMKKILKGL